MSSDIENNSNWILTFSKFSSNKDSNFNSIILNLGISSIGDYN